MNLKALSGTIRPIETKWHAVARQRLDSLTKPPGSLGRLEEFAARLVSVYGTQMPELPRKVVFTFAGDHGVAAEGVSAFPAEVTAQMVLNFVKGGAAINVLARHAGAEVVVVDIGVNFDFEASPGLVHKKAVYGTGNIAHGPAMTTDEALACLKTGIELADEYAGKGYRLFATGEMGIANTTPSAAIAAVITGRPVEDVTGCGTGIGDRALAKKMHIIRQAIDLNRPDPADGLDVLKKVGGAEIGGIAGLCLGAAERGIPVVVDGFISTAGALIAHTLNPLTAGYLFASHRSAEKGHRAMLAHMNLKPILDLDLRLGEGTGAALAMTILDAGLKIYREMATFAEAGVTDKSERG